MNSNYLEQNSMFLIPRAERDNESIREIKHFGFFKINTLHAIISN